MRRAYPFVSVALLLTACPSTSGTGGTGGTGAGTTSSSAGGAPADGGPSDAPYDVPISPPVDGSIADPCTLPGSVQFTSSGTVLVPGGGTTWPSLSFLHLPAGFCAHYYGTVGNARQLRFSTGSLDLFVASPTMLTTGGNGGQGKSAIIVLPDANLDGVGDAPSTFLSNLPSTQGLLFANSYFYYQDATAIMRVPYTPGDLAAGSASEEVADIANVISYQSALHWPKTLDMADDGTIYVGNGGDQGETCITPHPFHGGVVSINATPGPSPNGAQVAQGLRNPIAIRCRKGNNTCFALELAKDYTAGTGGREKLVHIHQGDDWGFPCCATQGLPYTDATPPPITGSCSGVAAETNAFLIGDTPFGLDFEMGHWTGMYGGRAFVATHGAAGPWTGARIVAIPIDASTGLPTASSDTTGSDVGMVDFATGWDTSADLPSRRSPTAARPRSPSTRMGGSSSATTTTASSSGSRRSTSNVWLHESPRRRADPGAIQQLPKPSRGSRLRPANPACVARITDPAGKCRSRRKNQGSV